MLCRQQQKTTLISAADVRNAVKSLNTGKAADLDGIRTEHLTQDNSDLYEALALIFTGMLTEGASPEMKTGKKRKKRNQKKSKSLKRRIRNM